MPRYYALWPAMRARRFVKALGGKPTKYEENMAFLAARAGVHPSQMDMVNPVTFAERNWIGTNARTLLGKQNYVDFDRMRNSTCHPSATWAYAMKEPIPPYVDPAVDQWAVEKATLKALLDDFAKASNEAGRVAVMGQIFTYTLTIEPFLRARSIFYKMMVAKVAEVKGEPVAASIMPIILKTEAFLEGIRPQTETHTPPPLKLQHLPMVELHPGEMAPVAEPPTQVKAVPLSSSARPSSLECSEDHDYMVVELEKNLYDSIERYDEAYKARSAEWNGANHMAVCQRAEEMDLALRLTTMDGMDAGVLIQAAHFGHKKVVNMVGDVLVRDHVGVDFCYENDFTALMYAAQAGHIDVVKALLVRGADPKRKNCNGETATHRAIVCGFPEVAVLLLDAILATK